MKLRTTFGEAREHPNYILTKFEGCPDNTCRAVAGGSKTNCLVILLCDFLACLVALVAASLVTRTSVSDAFVNNHFL